MKNKKYLAALVALLLLLAGIGGGFWLGRQGLPGPGTDARPVETSAVENVEPTEPAEAELSASATPDPWIVTVVEPSCETPGYTRYENTLDGTVRIEDGAPALGHSFGDWAADPDTGALSRVCAVCGTVQTREPVNASMPRIDLDGDLEGIGKAERVLLELRYQDAEEAFSCYALTSLQGHSSLMNEKKNYMIRLFDDRTLSEKHRMMLRPGWQLEHKYILKANYWDVSQCRNLICADIWADLVAARGNLPERLADSSHFGAVDGFPVTLWLNGAFSGLYTLNLHKDDDLFNMRGNCMDAVLICNAETMDEALFKADAVFETDVTDWEVEYCSTEDDAWTREKFNALSRLLRNADDGALRESLSKHLDVQAAEDYLLYIWAMGLTHSGAKDLVLLCYDDGFWIPSAYDMEEAFGLALDGTSALPADQWLPTRSSDGEWDTGTGSLLFDRLMRVFEPEILSRWRALRQGPLSDEAVETAAQTRLDAVPDELVQTDLLTFTDRTALKNPKEQIINYIHERLRLLDDVLGGAETLRAALETE